MIISIVCSACRQDSTSLIDEYYYHLSQGTCPPLHSQNERLGKELHLYKFMLSCEPIEVIRETYELMDSLNAHNYAYVANSKPEDWVDTVVLRYAQRLLYQSHDSIVSWNTKELFLTDRLSSLSISEWYHYLRLLLIDSNKYYKLSQVSESQIVLDYVLHLLHKYELTHTLPSVYIDALTIKGSRFLFENEVDHTEYGKLAITMYTNALSIMDEYNITDKWNIAYINLSEAYKKHGDTIKAISMLVDFPKERKLNYMDSTYLNAVLAYDYNDYRQYQNAIEAFRSSPHLDYLGIAESHLGLGQIDSALYYCDKALNMKRLHSIDSIDTLYYTLEVLHEIHKQQYIATQDLSHLDTALTLLDQRASIASSIFGDDISFHNAEQKAFHAEQVLQTIELYPYHHGSISRSAAKLALKNIVDAKEINFQSRLLQDIRKIHDHKLIDRYDDEIYSDLYQKHIIQKKTKTTRVTHFSLPPIKSILSNEGTQLHVLKSQNYYWFLVIDKHHYRLYKEPVEELESVLTSIIDSIIQDRPIPEHSDLLAFLDRYHDRTLYIYPDGILSEYPWEMLIDCEEQKIYTNAYYRDTIDLSARQATVLSYTDRVTNRDSDLEYEELLGGYEESISISELLGCPLVSGYAFTRDAIMKAMQYDHIHISCHAYADADIRAENYIIVRDSIGQATKMYTDEVLHQNISPKMVVLSACETGSGIHMAGAGTYTLSRSFLRKGSQAVIKTLWNVNDQKTKRFMQEYYAAWISGKSNSEAIQLAKTKLRSSSDAQDPRDWAGFVLEGNPNLYISKN